MPVPSTHGAIAGNFEAKPTNYTPPHTRNATGAFTNANGEHGNLVKEKKKTQQFLTYCQF